MTVKKGTQPANGPLMMTFDFDGKEILAIRADEMLFGTMINQTTGEEFISITVRPPADLSLGIYFAFDAVQAKRIAADLLTYASEIKPPAKIEPEVER